MSTSVTQRLSYIDMVKIFAMFIVTWGHCAQCLSNETFPSLFGVQGLFIPMHMPLFIFVSGFFINFQKTRSHSWKESIQHRFCRLMLPALCWYILYCISTISRPSPSGVFMFYWFLSSMFLCYVIIDTLAKIVHNDILLLLILVAVNAIPGISFLNINFMLPFLLSGYFFKHYYINKNHHRHTDTAILIASGALTLLLYLYWDVDYSVYRSPFDTKTLQWHTLPIFLYRYTLGTSCSIFFILLFRKMEFLPLFAQWSRYGQYTLTMYVFSFIVNGVIQRFFWKEGLTQPILLEIASAIMSLLVCAMGAFVHQLLQKNRKLGFFLLGESKSTGYHFLPF